MSEAGEGVHPAHRRPLWFAALIAWFAVPLLSALFFFAVEDVNPWGAAGGILAFGLFFSAIGVFLLELPLLLLIRVHGHLSVSTVLATATVAGALALIIGSWLMFHAWPGYFLAWLGAAFGVAGGLVLCVAAGIPWRRRPT